MTASDSASRLPRLDEPWRRAVWLAPTALLLWAILLMGFAVLLRSTARPLQSIEPLDARLLEIPAPAAPGGLQGALENKTAPPLPAPPRQPQPQVERRPQVAPGLRPRERKPTAPTVFDTHGAHTAPSASESAPSDQPPAEGKPAAAGSGSAGRSEATGLGSDNIGARAIYAPVPRIPDELREDVLQAVAVAHFQVTYDGIATVALTQPTTNPRLNALLLDSLQKWRFLPAVRRGVAIDSAFDVRIPIAVQ
jgi:protein TonB